MKIPGLPAVVALIEPAVAAENKASTVAGVDPERVMIRMNSLAAGLEGRAAVVAFVKTDSHHVHMPVVRRIHSQLAVIKWTRIEAVDPLPTLASVGRLVDAAGVVVFLSVLLLLNFLFAGIGILRGGEFRAHADPRNGEDGNEKGR